MLPPAPSARVAAAATAGPDPTRVAEAHAQLLNDRSIQFDFPAVPVQSNSTPAWLEATLKAIAGFIQWVGRGWTVIFWVIVAALIIALVVALVPGFRDTVVAWWRRGRGAAVAEEQRWTPQASAARELLAEADRLAAEGQFGEAVHLILYRSIDDIERWRDDIVQPALTSRDIAAAQALPEQARGVFRRIVALVERSVFAGRPLSSEDWQSARADYAGFALGRA